MREPYSVASVAESWSPSTPIRGEAPILAGSALLLIDLQAYFLDPESPAYLPASGPVVAALGPLLACYRARRLPVILTRHVDDPAPDAPMHRWWDTSLRADDPLSAIDPKFAPHDGEIVIEKDTYDAFRRTDLSRILHESSVERIVIGGVMTHLCCETTARSAFLHGYRVHFLSDGTATISERHHLATLDNLSHGFARITRMEEILDAACR